MKTLSKWIEVTGHFDHDTDGEFVYDCELPEDGQEILVTLIGGDIGRDICYVDKMGYHLESGWDREDVFKWAPMPPAWWEETHDKRTEMHSCDCVSRQVAIDALDGEIEITGRTNAEAVKGYVRLVRDRLERLPSAQPEQHTCVNCGRTVNNGGWYADGRTRCPIEEHYALPKDGFCHLWEERNITDDDYPERREE